MSLALRRHQGPSKFQPAADGSMTLIDHIRELRNRLFWASLGLVLGIIVGFLVSGWVFHLLEQPYCKLDSSWTLGKVNQGTCDFLQLGVGDGLMLKLKIALWVGIIIGAPVWLYQLWAFIAPGLYAREKRWGHIFLATAIPLFLLGNLLAYLSLGRSMHYLLDLTPHGVQNLIQVDLYMSFVMTMLLAFGIALELPLLIVMLNLAGILTHERFRKWRRVLIFVVFLIAGIANPSPDPITMLILGGACVALVEVAELIIWRHDRRQARLHPDPYAGLADDELSPLDLDDTGSRDSHLN